MSLYMNLQTYSAIELKSIQKDCVDQERNKTWN